MRLIISIMCKILIEVDKRWDDIKVSVAGDVSSAEKARETFMTLCGKAPNEIRYAKVPYLVCTLHYRLVCLVQLG